MSNNDFEKKFKINPFQLNFGLKPSFYIERFEEVKDAIMQFEEGRNNTSLFSGLRGSGKTVILNQIKEHFNKNKDWMVFEFITNEDILEQFASFLYDKCIFFHIINSATFGFSFCGVNFSIKGEKPITNIINLIKILLDHLKDKKILICLDEVYKNEHVVSFIQTFQILLRQNYNLYLLMTGLYKNIFDIQNEKSLTFLLRSPKTFLKPLLLTSIATIYKTVFDVPLEKAVEFAKFTKGYSFAFQLLGYLLWENQSKDINANIILKFDEYMQDYVYMKIWSELSANDKRILKSFTKDDECIVDLLKKSGMSKSEFSVYRSRLLKIGLLQSNTYGKLSIMLPRFRDFVLICDI